MNRRRAALIGAGVATVAAAGVVAGRVLIRRERNRPDPEAAESLTELPPEDLGPVVSFDETLLAVRAAGEEGRPTLVFAHGISLDMTTWHFQWKEFASRYRCVMFDARGHGASGRPPSGDFSLQAMGRDLKSVLDAVAPEGPVVVVGHSMGGMAMLAFAEAFPDEFGGSGRVVGAVLADTAASDLLRGFVSGAGERLLSFLREPQRAGRIHRYFQARGSNAAFGVARLTNFGRDASPSVVAHVAGLGAKAPLEVWTDALAGLFEMDLRHAIRHVAVPSLVVVGEVDRITPSASARALVRELPQGRLVEIEGAGHLAMMERHREFNRVLDRFLDEVLAAAAAGGRRRKSR